MAVTLFGGLLDILRISNPLASASTPLFPAGQAPFDRCAYERAVA
jgi:hypothetical protein